MQLRLLSRIEFSFQILLPPEASFWEAWKWNEANFYHFDLCKTLKTKTTVYHWLLWTLFSCNPLIYILILFFLDTLQTFKFILIIVIKHLSAKFLIASGWSSGLVNFLYIFASAPLGWQKYDSSHDLIPSFLPPCVETVLFCREMQSRLIGSFVKAKVEVWLCLNWLSFHQKHLSRNNSLFLH